MSTKTYADLKIYRALKAQLDTLPGGLSVVDPSGFYPQSATVPFVLMQDERMDTERLYVTTEGADKYEGIFYLAVMTPLSGGKEAAMPYVGMIKEHFKKGVTLLYDDVTVRIKRTPHASGGMRDEAYWREPVLIYWQAIA